MFCLLILLFLLFHRRSYWHGGYPYGYAAYGYPYGAYSPYNPYWRGGYNTYGYGRYGYGYRPYGCYY